MMTIRGRHITKATVERRRRNSRRPGCAEVRPTPCMTAGAGAAGAAGAHVWTVSAMPLPLTLWISLWSRCHYPCRPSGPAWDLSVQPECAFRRATFPRVHSRPLDHVVELLVALGELGDHHGVDRLVVDLG